MRNLSRLATLPIAGALWSLVVWASPPASSSSAAAVDETRLDDGRTIERPLARGDTHLYRIALKRGEYLRVTVAQRGIDLVVRTRDANGRTIAEFEDEIRKEGDELVDLVAEARGAYTIAIEAATGTVAPGSYAIRIATRRAATEADRSMQDARRLRTSAAQLEMEGRFGDARVSLERALAITERVRGPDDVQVGEVAAQLAGVYRWLSAGPKSKADYDRAIAIFERTLGAGHPVTAVARSQLALLYQRQGERRLAETLLRDALETIERTLGPNHPAFVSCLATLGDIRESAADYDEEEAIVRRALTITEKIGDTDSLQYASLLTNLGEVYRHKQDYARAEDALQRSLALGERLLGPDNYSIATALQNLGIIARERKDYRTAVAYNTRALSIRERMVGPDHPDVAHILTNLANIYRATGDYSRSLDTHLRALRIWEHAAGPYQDATLLSVGNIAKTYAAMGDVADAIAYQRRSDAMLEKQLALNLAIGSERQKLAFVRSAAERTDRTISLHLDQAPRNPEAGALAALVILQRKGRVQDAMIDVLAAVRQRVADPADRALLDRLNETTAELARLALNAPDPARPEERGLALARLEAQQEQLEATLSEHSAEFRAEALCVTLEAVQAAIPERAALLEFAVFHPFDPRAERNAEAYGPPHYAAYVLRRHEAPAGVDLGETAGIDRAIKALRESLHDPVGPDVTARARGLDERIMRRLRPFLGDATRLLVSPDGELNLVPFEALVDERGGYLIERYAIGYVTSGRDLLRMQVTRPSHGKPVIFADPLFGEPAATPRNGARGATPPVTAGGVTAGDLLSTVYFAPLAASAEEARAIKALFPDATLVTGPRATKAVLQGVRAPLLLHIASHGFFLEDAARAGGPGAAGENPLLRSGLALAGANLTRGGHGDGILTALEAAGLDLWGTKLVTLSGCDTGIGEVRNGEGVYGLRRAFVLAGAETLVMSLWPVSDSIARDAMVAYYAGLRAGLGRADALRQAKLAMMKRPNRRHPYYWAGFIQSGEWTPLS